MEAMSTESFKEKHYQNLFTQNVFIKKSYAGVLGSGLQRKHLCAHIYLVH